MKNLITSNYLIIIIFLAICIAGIGCNSIFDIFPSAENSKLKNENMSLKFSLDSLSNSFDSLLNDYTAIKNKNPDTVFIYSPIDSINWIDSIRYVLKDSVVIVPHDTLIIHLKDSLVYNYRDTTVYNYRDSISVTYDDKNFPTETINKYLNLFFQTERLTDTTGLHFNVLIFDGPKLDYKYDSLYQVPDSVIGWRLDWYSENCKIPSLR